MNKDFSVIVIGGGISGLSTAFWLKQNGVNVTILEKSNRAGGTIKTDSENGYLVEYGPNSALETTPLINKLINELGISGEKVAASKQSNKRYILKNGQLYALPMGPISFLSTRLFSVSAKLRLFKEPFIKSKSHPKETIAEFTERRLGREFLDYAINPFVAGVFAGNPETLNVKTAFPKLYELEQDYGSLIGGSIKSARKRKKSKEKSKQSAGTFSFKNGMQILTDSLLNGLKEEIKLNCDIKAICRSSSEKGISYDVEFNLNGEHKHISSDAIVVSAPSDSASKLVAAIDSSLSSVIENVHYPPVNVVFMGFKNSNIGFHLDGFGYLIPAKENRKILGTLWNSILFKGRAPEGFQALTSFVGGSRSPELTEKSDDELIDVVLREMNSIMGVEGKPDFVKIIRWERAIPQYNNSYVETFDEIERSMKQNPGLFICSNYYRGISVGDCIKNADATVISVLDYKKNFDN